MESLPGKNRHVPLTDHEINALWSTYAKTGERDIANTIFEQTWLFGFGIAYRLLEYQENDAKDIVQEVFKHLVEHRASESMQNIKNFKGLLYTITLHKCIDYHRRKKHRRLHVSLQDFDREGCQSINHGIDADILVQAAQDVLFGNQMYSDVIEARMQGYANPEIAEQMGKSEKTIRQAVYHARKKIKDRFSGLGY